MQMAEMRPDGRAAHAPSMTYGRTTPDLDRPGGDIPPDSPYVADTMPTLAKAPRYRSACGLARDGSPPSAAYSPMVHPSPSPYSPTPSTTTQHT